MATPLCRCKFKLKAIRTEVQNRHNPDTGETEPRKLYDLEFQPVTTGDEDPLNENEQFWEATPSGTFHFKTINRGVAKGFEVGDQYYFDILPVPA